MLMHSSTRYVYTYIYIDRYLNNNTDCFLSFLLLSCSSADVDPLNKKNERFDF